MMFPPPAALSPAARDRWPLARLIASEFYTEPDLDDLVEIYCERWAVLEDEQSTGLERTTSKNMVLGLGDRLGMTARAQERIARVGR